MSPDATPCIDTDAAQPLSDSALRTPAPSAHSARPALLCFSHLRWNFVYQRPQHLLTRFARTHRVYYMEEPVATPDAQPWLERMETAEGVTVLVPHLPPDCDAEQAARHQRALLDAALRDDAVRPSVLWYYTPMSLAFSGHLAADAVVYDCMDELSAFRGAPPQLTAREAQLLQRADLVFTGGHSLYEAKRGRHHNVHAFPSSVDVAHFRQAREALECPADQRDIAGPRMGFYGVLDERFDIDLVARIAGLRPSWQFIFVGPVVKIDPATLPRAANIHYLGPKRYEELPAYLAGWDVALMPFAINESTRFISPTKTPEFLAAGKPVVSTPITDVMRAYGDCPMVRIARDAQSFVHAAEAALDDSRDRAALGRAADAALADLSWDRTWTEMGALLAEAAVRTAEPATSVDAPAPTPDTQVARNPAARRDADSAEMPATTAHITVARDAAIAAMYADGARILQLHAPANDKRDAARKEGPRIAGPRIGHGKAAHYDYLVVGAGFAGSVLAERLAAGLNQRVLVVDRRPHIGGNAYDHYNEHGVLVHRYGPHIFHTNADKVVDYLSRFTGWRPYQHRVLARVDDMLVPMPINLKTLSMLYGRSFTPEQATAFLAERAETPDTIRSAEDMVVSQVGRDLYEKFFRGYTRKQWGLDPSELDRSVTARVPTRTSHDDRYFTDRFQAMPDQGYTRMFENMLSHPNIDIWLGVDFREVRAAVQADKIIYTGPVDEYFDYRYGRLPYRSLVFRHETVDQETFQPAAVVNYPAEDVPYTRITEYKHLTGQQHPKTSVTYEFPSAEGDPYYPVPRPENAELYKRYEALADQTKDVYFVGRLATYRYYNMDQVVGQALSTFARIEAGHQQRHAVAPQPAVA
jgi:UDP-galactopyranose mutase